MRMPAMTFFLVTLAACQDTSDDSNDGGATDGGTADGGTGDGGSDGGGQSSTLLQVEFVFDLDATGGCSDTWLHAWDADGMVGMELYVPGILAEAISAGGPVIRPYTVGVDDFELLVEVADPVAGNYCTDTPSDREILESWTATAGGLVVVVEPPMSSGGDGKASIELSMATLDDGAGHSIEVPGWFAAEIPIVQGWGG